VKAYASFLPVRSEHHAALCEELQGSVPTFTCEIDLFMKLYAFTPRPWPEKLGLRSGLWRKASSNFPLCLRQGPRSVCDGRVSAKGRDTKAVQLFPFKDDRLFRFALGVPNTSDFSDRSIDQQDGR
jgi:hypothetical protein